MAELRKARLTGIRVKVPAEALDGKLARLPDGVSVERDRIEVRFGSAKEGGGAASTRWPRRSLAITSGLRSSSTGERADDRRESVGMSEALVPAAVATSGRHGQGSGGFRCRR